MIQTRVINKISHYIVTPALMSCRTPCHPGFIPGSPFAVYYRETFFETVGFPSTSARMMYVPLW